MRCTAGEGERWREAWGSLLLDYPTPVQRKECAVSEDVERFRCVDADGFHWIVTSGKLLRSTNEENIIEDVPMEDIQWTKIHRAFFGRGVEPTLKCITSCGTREW